MALLFIDGFDHYDPQALDAQGYPLLARGKATYLSSRATRIQGRRPSSYALRLPAGGGGGYIKDLGVFKTGLIVGAAFRVASLGNNGAEPLLLGVGDSGEVLHFVAVSSDGKLKLYRNLGGFENQLISTSTATIAAGGWNYVELRVVQGTNDGTLSVRVNEVLVIHLTGQDTIRGGTQLLTVFLGALPYQNCPATVDVDDFYVADTGGTINNTFLGNVRVDILKPQGNGSLNEWTVTPTNAIAWQVVSDNNESSAIVAEGDDLRQTFGVNPLPVGATPAIHGVQLTMLAHRADGGADRIKGLIVSEGQSAVSPNLILYDRPSWRTAMFERSPNDNAQWTEGALNNAEFGVESAWAFAPPP